MPNIIKIKPKINGSDTAAPNVKKAIAKFIISLPFC